MQDDQRQLRLLPNDKELVLLGKDVYAQQCAACHGANLEGQANWRQRDNKGYMPAPPHDANGHTWHHPDEYLFSVTKYGIEETLGREYPNNMPAYETHLTDKQIVAVLSYIKSTWSERIQNQHDQINIRANNQ
ncbi:MAG: c-type cytochrome [Pseudomonadales bacterium]